MVDRIEGRKIVLRKARMDDLDSIYENIFHNMDVLKYMFLMYSDTIEEAKERMSRTIAFQKDKDAFLIALKDSDLAIGVAGIKEEKEGVYSEAGIGIGSKYFNQGIGSEVLSLLLDLAFNTYNAKEFAYYCMKENEVSKKLALKFNFKYDSEAKEIRKRDNKEFIIERYILRKREYQNG